MSKSSFQFSKKLEIQSPSRWSLEYDDSILYRESKIIPSIPPEWCPDYDTYLHLMVRLQFWRSGWCGFTTVAITPRLTLACS